MITPKLKHVLAIICSRFSQEGIDHALIGAMAMAYYGLPRYTADIDLLASNRHRRAVGRIMTAIGLECYQDAARFAQFTSELGLYGKVDVMFVQTTDGHAMLDRAVVVDDSITGAVPVVQPTDYAVLKLLAIANNPERDAHDTADLDALIRLAATNAIPTPFEALNIERLIRFAERFRLSPKLGALITPLATNRP